MTKNMLAAVEKLFRAKDNTDWVVYATAVALERKGLVLTPTRQRTGGRGFPMYFVSLSAAGKAFCRRRYQRVGKHDQA